MNGLPTAPLAPPPVGQAFGGQRNDDHLVSDQQGFGAPALGSPGMPVPNPGSARMKLGAVVGAIAVGLAAGALWGGLGPAPAKSPSEVRLEAISFAGDSPFMPPVGEDRSGVDAPVNTAGTFSGDTPGLFAADENKPSCDTRSLISNLQADPGKAGAWADAVGITATDIPGYVDTLNPVVLRSDTAVTQYGYENGTFVPYPAVLEAGTAAFVNSRGEPRAKCFSGNPLSGTPALQNVSYVGPGWNRFAPTTVTYVKPAPVVIKVYVYVDIDHHNSYHHDSKPSWDHDDLSWCDRHPDSDKCDHHHGGKDHDVDGQDHGKGGKDGQEGKGGQDGNGGGDGQDAQNGQDKDPKDGQNPPAGPEDKNKAKDKDDKAVDHKNGQPGIDEQAKLLTGNGAPTTGGKPENLPKVEGPAGQHEISPLQSPIEKLKDGSNAGPTDGGTGSTGTGSTGPGGTGAGTGTTGTTKPGAGPTGTGATHRVGRPTATGTAAGADTSTGTATGTDAATGTGTGTGSGPESGGEHTGAKHSGHND